MSHPDAHQDAVSQRYADLLPAGEADPTLTRLVLDLDRFMDAPTPPALEQRIARTLLARATSHHERPDAQPVTDARPARRPHLLVSFRGSGAAQGSRLFRKPSRVPRPLVAAAVVLVTLLALSGGGTFALSQMDPGLARQLGIPVATGPEYTKLEITHTVGDATVTLSRAAFTTKQVIVGYVYDHPVRGPGDTRGNFVCALSLTSREGDTFRAYAGDNLPTMNTDGTFHGSTVMYFAVEHLANGNQERNLRLALRLCDDSGADHTGDEVAFDFSLPVQR